MNRHFRSPDWSMTGAWQPVGYVSPKRQRRPFSLSEFMEDLEPLLGLLSIGVLGVMKTMADYEWALLQVQP